jgi:hypothetical protein
MRATTIVIGDKYMCLIRYLHENILRKSSESWSIEKKKRLIKSTYENVDIKTR